MRPRNQIARLIGIFAPALFVIVIESSATLGDGGPAEQFFEAKVRPVLVERCFACHGATNTQGNLRLDSAENVRKGRGAGPVVVPGDPESSPLVHAIRQDGAIKMPPGTRLRPDEIAALTEWVRQGAAFPVDTNARTGVRRGEFKITDSDRQFWAFRPVRKPPVPKVSYASWGDAVAGRKSKIRNPKSEIRNPIDAFILAKLDAAGLKPAPPADRRTLIRRAYFDLIGLPPTPEDVRAFYADRAPDAFAKVIDRLLASPQYGERWGRHWLDVVRYADSNGLDENVAFANAWRYRDYVVNALNKDKPYDQFVREQLAGDLIPATDATLRNERITATGFLSLGAKVLAESDKDKMVMDIVDEQIEVASKAFMGLTVACARCHNHKFDPISTQDYYALAGIFKSTKTMQSLATVAMWHERPLTSTEMDQKTREYEPRLQTAREGLRIAEVNAKSDKSEASIKAVDEAKANLKRFEDAAPKPPMAMAVEDSKAANCRVHIRGSTQQLGEEVPRRFVTILAGDVQKPLPATTSGRLELAEWLVSPSHPLTARVAVNRIWQGHFGEALVRTPDNWGFLGERPTHPELLDWLAATFVAKDEGGRMKDESDGATDSSFILHPSSFACGWSLKRLHRLIMLSNAYQMQCVEDPKAFIKDPENRLLWRANRRRLEAEPFRDSILTVAGKLDLTMGGSLLTTGNHGYVTNDQSGNEGRYHHNRRAIYLPVIRNALYDMFQTFDVGDPCLVNAKRVSTTIAPQALFVMNSPFALEMSGACADAMLAMPGWSDAQRVEQAYLKCLTRSPRQDEVARALAFLARYDQSAQKTEPDQAKRKRLCWQSLCQTLFASNEFIYVD